MNINEEDFLTQIGRAEKDGRSCTFVRVIHRPTGKVRTLVGIGKEKNVVERLTRELIAELEASQ